MRALTEADAPTYREIRLRSLREEPDAFVTSYEEEVARPLVATFERLHAQEGSPDNFILGAFGEDDRLLGVLTFSRFERVKERHKAGISGVFVIPEARRAGLGRALVAEAIARARKLDGLVLIQLTVIARKEIARRLYLSLGFVPFGLEHRAVKLGDDFFDEEYLALELR